MNDPAYIEFWLGIVGFYLINFLACLPKKGCQEEILHNKGSTHHVK